MATIARGSKAGGGTNFNSGQTIDPSEVNTDLNTVYTEFNGNISNANISATAAIAASKISGLSYTRIATLTTEQTTTSITAVDLATISGLNIPVTSWIFIWFETRKSAGAAAGAGIGLKLNTTVVREAVVGEFPEFTSTNQVEQVSGLIVIPPPGANYLRTGRLITFRHHLITPGAVNVYPFSVDHPNVAVTSLILRGISGSSLVTLAVNQIVGFEGVMT